MQFQCLVLITQVMRLGEVGCFGVKGAYGGGAGGGGGRELVDSGVGKVIYFPAKIIGELGRLKRSQRGRFCQPIFPVANSRMLSGIRRVLWPGCSLYSQAKMDSGVHGSFQHVSWDFSPFCLLLAFFRCPGMLPLREKECKC